MSRRTVNYDRPYVKAGMPMIIGVGLTAGLIGGAIMTLGQKVEQVFTGRPNSEVPGLTCARLLGRPDSHKGALNLPFHYAQGAIVGVIRAAMSVYGIRGPVADFMFTGVRLLNDQTLENYTGAGALPWTWPVSEQVIDIFGKALYAFVTGWVCDAWLQ